MSHEHHETPRNSKARRVGVIGAVAAVGAAAGVVAGFAAERYLIRRAREDPDDVHGEEPFGELHSDQVRTVTTADGISVHVEKVGTRRAGDVNGAKPVATVVFVHGYCLGIGTFHFQRRALEESSLPVRAVYYDQPGHGNSGPLPDFEYEIDGLAETLYAVLAQAVPAGPVILVGHSMGGMTIMAFARRFPELFAKRVRGVALLSTTAGGLGHVTFGAPRLLARARKLFLPLLGRAANLTPGAIDRARAAAGDLAWVLTRRYGFSDPKPSSSLVSYVENMNTATAIRTVTGFSRALLEHDERDSLPLFRDVPVFISCGADDAFTPASHSEALAAALPHAKLSIVPDTAHVSLMERPDEVSQPLLEHIEAVVADLGARADSDGAKKRKPWMLRKRKGDVA